MFTDIFLYLLSVSIFLNLIKVIVSSVILKGKGSINYYYVTPINEKKHIDIVVAAFNEEKVIISTVNNLLDINYENYTIFVIDDGSSDSTLELLTSNYHNFKNVKIISKPNEGKAKALNHFVKFSSAEIIFFVDADTKVEPNSLNVVNSYFQAENLAAISGHLEISNPTNPITRSQELEYLVSLNLEREILQKVNLFTTIPGAICAIKRKVLKKIGCFDPQRVTEDGDITFRILGKGLAIRNARDLIGYTEAPNSTKMFLRQRIRWEFGLIQNLWYYFRRVLINPLDGKYTVRTLFVIFYSLLFKILMKILNGLIDFIFLGLLFNGVFKVVLYFVPFVVFELIILVGATYLTNGINRLSLGKIIFYRTIYRNLLLAVFLFALAKFINGEKVKWKKIQRYNT